MVSRKRLRTFLTVLCLYVAAALLIGYFSINAYTGNRGLKAQQDIDHQIVELTAERDRLRLERTEWQRRVGLLRPESLDPDMVDERARAILNYLHPRELTLILKRP